MIFRNGSHEQVNRPTAADGTSGACVEFLVAQEHLGSSGRLFAHITLQPGAAVQPHAHQGEFEIYYILSGTGVYLDNGAEVTLYPGDVAYCPSGEGHALFNRGEQPVTLVAFVGFGG